MKDKPTIAVVGKGGSLKGKGYGEEIDAHDIVIRFHGVKPLESYTRDLGRKWTWLATGLNNGIYQHIEPDTEKIMCPLWRERFGDRIKYAPDRLKDAVEWMPRRMAMECQRTVGAWPTTGCFLLYWLKCKGILKQTTIYGIDGYKSGYYSGEKHNIPAHNMDKEIPILDWLKTKAAGHK